MITDSDDDDGGSHAMTKGAGEQVDPYFISSLPSLSDEVSTAPTDTDPYAHVS